MRFIRYVLAATLLLWFSTSGLAQCLPQVPCSDFTSDTPFVNPYNGASNASSINKNFSHVYNMVDNGGAVGDGVADNAPILTAALSTASSTGATAIIFPSGNFNFNIADGANFSLPANVCIIGDGDATILTLTNVSSNFKSVFTFNGDNDCVRDLKIQSTMSGSGYYFLIAGNHDYIDHIYLDGGNIVAQPAINTIHGLYPTASITDFTLSNSTITHVRYGFLKANTDTTTQTDLKFLHNRFIENFGDDISFNTPDGTISGVLVQGNLFQDNQSGPIYGTFGIMLGAASVQDFRYASNLFKGQCITDAIHLEENILNGSIVNNVFDLNTGSSIATLGAITGGTGGTAGTYLGVTLTGGAGSGATADITVAGGAVTAVTLRTDGTTYAVGNTLSAASGSIGGVTGFSVPVATVSTGCTGINILANNVSGTSFGAQRLTIVGNTIQSSVGVANTGRGVWVENSVQTAPSGISLVIADNYVGGFSYGIFDETQFKEIIKNNYLTGNSTALGGTKPSIDFSGNRIYNNGTGASFSYGGILGPQLFSNNTTNVGAVTVSNGGKIVTSQFRLRLGSVSIPTGTSNVTLFPASATQTFNGTLVFTFLNIGAPYQNVSSATVNWDGTTLTTTNLASLASGNYTINSLSVTGGNLVANVTSASGTSVNTDIDISVTGSYRF